MRVLIDTNIILDWLMLRNPFYEKAEHIMRECFFGEINGYITSHTLTDLFYILRKDFSIEDRKQLLLLLCGHFQIISEDKDVMVAVLNNDKFNDFEDGLQMMCASMQRLDYIITRNISDFKNSIIPAISPEDFLDMYFSQKE